MSDKSKCSWCGPDKSHQKISHGICPDCEAKYFPEFTRVKKPKQTVKIYAGVPACQRSI